jgi:hypothetical protein
MYCQRGHKLFVGIDSSATQGSPDLMGPPWDAGIVQSLECATRIDCTRDCLNQFDR